MYPWLQPIESEWQRAIELQRVSSATLMVTRPGFGTETLREKMIQGLLCQVNSAGCGNCHSCRLLAAHSHPDWHLVRPEKEGKAITVDQIRQANRVAVESSQLGGPRVISIEQADRMNEAAANALLKTLEEPPPRCYFLLSTHRRDRLLPTILSRCQPLTLMMPPVNVISDWLATQLTEPVPEYVLKINGYAPLLTKDFILNNELTLLDSLINEFCQYLLSPVELLYSMVDLLAQAPRKYLEWLWYIFADAQKIQLNVPVDAMLPGSDVVSQYLTYDVLYQQSKKLTQLFADWTQFSGLNTELLITNWLLNFNEVLCS